MRLTHGIKKLIFTLLFIKAFGLNGTCFAENSQANQAVEQETKSNVSNQWQADMPRPLVINIQGKISKLLLEKIRKMTQKLPTEHQFPPALLVILDSNGGDGDAAIEIGKILRSYHAHVFVSEKCGSACIFTFAGGEFRTSPPSSIGIHKPRVTLSDNGARTIKELDVSQSEHALHLLNNFDKKASDYLVQMGMGDGLYERIQSQKTKELYWLDEREVERYKLNGYTSEALEITTNQLHQKTAGQIDQNKVLANSADVLKECISLKKDTNNFAQCYINVMTRP